MGWLSFILFVCVSSLLKLDEQESVLLHVRILVYVVNISCNSRSLFILFSAMTQGTEIFLSALFYLP